ncbi:MAG: winged helix-turn-helix transcriptional regulator [Balneola sp.]
MNSSPFNISDQHESVEHKIIVVLERISEAFRVLLWNESKEHSLSPIQVQVLIFLHYHSADKRKVSHLAKEFNVTKATISDTVKTLEKKQLISKSYEPDDARSFTIDLTAKGIEVASRTSHFTKEIQTPINKLPQQEKENLLLNLIGVIHHLNQAGVISIQRMCLTCSFYRKNDNGHYCNLLKQPLNDEELRVDCPEHVLN